MIKALTVVGAVVIVGGLALKVGMDSASGPAISEQEAGRRALLGKWNCGEQGTHEFSAEGAKLEISAEPFQNSSAYMVTIATWRVIDGASYLLSNHRVGATDGDKFIDMKSVIKDWENPEEEVVWEYQVVGDKLRESARRKESVAIDCTRVKA